MNNYELEDVVIKLSHAAVRFEAELHTLRLILGVVLAHSPETVDALSNISKKLPDLLINYNLTDEQNEMVDDQIKRLLQIAKMPQ